MMRNRQLSEGRSGRDGPALIMATVVLWALVFALYFSALSG